MNRHQALALLANERHTVPKGETYTADDYKPADGPRVARLFYAVYGRDYPIDTYYLPERLTEENHLGNIRSAVARTVSGEVVAHAALYRSSPPNPRLYEYGVGLTHPDYRSTMAFFRVHQLLMQLVGQEGIDGIYGEAVCNHTITQKLTHHGKAIETAVEPALMPAEAYAHEWQGIRRVGCLVSFRVDVDQRKPLYVPAPYRQQLGFILEGITLDRELINADTDSTAGEAAIEVQRFDFAGVARCTVTRPGADLPGRLLDLERQAQADNWALLQFFVDLGQPWAGGVVEQLRNQGYALGGLLPIWFGTDGLLMQKHLVDPDFEGMKIHTDRGRALVELIRNEWLRSQA